MMIINAHAGRIMVDRQRLDYFFGIVVRIILMPDGQNSGTKTLSPTGATTVDELFEEDVEFSGNVCTIGSKIV